MYYCVSDILYLIFSNHIISSPTIDRFKVLICIKIVNDSWQSVVHCFINIVIKYHSFGHNALFS